MFNFERKTPNSNIMNFPPNFYDNTFLDKPKFQLPFIFSTSKSNDISEIYTKTTIKNIFDNFSKFKGCFLSENIHIKDEKLLFDFFINNENIDLTLIKKITKLIRYELKENREIIITYDKEYQRTLGFLIRQSDYHTSNLKELISQIENKIIDILDDDYPNSCFDILFYMDYEKPEFLNTIKGYSGV